MVFGVWEAEDKRDRTRYARIQRENEPGVSMKEAEEGMVLHSCNPSTWEQQQEAHPKFRVSLMYITSSWQLQLQITAKSAQEVQDVRV